MRHAYVFKGLFCCSLLALAALQPSVVQAQSERAGTAGNTQPSIQQSPEAYLRVAQRLYNKGDFGAAANFYQRVLALESTNDQALVSLGEILLAQSAIVPALEHFQRWAALRPKDARPYVALAQLYNRNDQPLLANSALDHAQELGAPPAQIFLERGLAFDLNGVFSTAQALYTQAYKLEPQNTEVKLRLALSLALSEDYQAALQILQQAYSKNSSAQDRVRRTLALVYALAGQTDNAVIIQGVEDVDDKQSQRQRLFLEHLGKLSARDKARAVYLGILPTHTQTIPITERATPIAEQKPAQKPAMAERAVSLDVPAVTTPHAPVGQPPRMIALPQGAVNNNNPVQPTGSAPAMRSAPLEASDRHWVQLALEPNRARLVKSWEQINAQAQGFLQSLQPYLQQIMVNGRPMVRLMVGGYSDGDTARALAERLQAFGLKAVLNRNAAPADPLFP